MTLHKAKYLGLTSIMGGTASYCFSIQQIALGVIFLLAGLVCLTEVFNQ